MNVNWKIKSFIQLSGSEIYEALRLRQEVFILEQKSLYPDIDDKDLEAYHVLGTQENELIAYARFYTTPAGRLHLGRVLVEKKFRGRGFAKEMLSWLISHFQSEYPKHTIKISAQTYLEGFYQSFGFRTTSSPYDDAGVQHIDMEKDLRNLSSHNTRS